MSTHLEKRIKMIFCDLFKRINVFEFVWKYTEELAMPGASFPMHVIVQQEIPPRSIRALKLSSKKYFK